MDLHKYEIECYGCRIRVPKGDKLGAINTLLAHLRESHAGEDWLNMIKTETIKMNWRSPYETDIITTLTTNDVLDFMALMVKDGDIPYEDWMQFKTANKTGE